MDLPGKGLQWIGGEWVVGRGDSWRRRSPGDQRVTWDSNMADEAQVAEAVSAASTAFQAWSLRSLDERASICESFARHLKANGDELAELIAIENGKPLWEAKTEVAASVAKVANSIEAIRQRRWTTRQEIGDYQAVTRFQPHGVMFVIGPFNFPAHVPGGHIIPALLAGNTIVFKPSEWVPAIGQWLAKAWEASGVPAGVVNLIQGGGSIGAAAVAHEKVDGVLFTGSAKVGVALHRAMAGQPQRVLALELGGNNPLVVHGTSDFVRAAKTVILSAYLTSGQRCTCTRRLIVSGEESFQQLKHQLAEGIGTIRIGRSLDDPAPFMGPLIHEEAAEQMIAAQAALIDSGGVPVVTMQPSDDCQALVSPGLMEVGPQEDLEDCENFGPLLRIQAAQDLDHAIEIARATRFGLSAGFIGDSRDDFEYFLERSHAGVVNWNRQTTGASGKLPFGGVGLSGNHQPSGAHAADYCSYPVASLESDELSEADKPIPGLGI